MSGSPDWSNIDTLFLDMDGTLLDLHFDNHFWLEYVPVCFADKNNISREEADKVLMSRYAAVKGKLDWYCIDFWSRELDLDIAQLKYDVSHKIAVRPEVVDFLVAIKASGKTMALVTNAHPASLLLKMNKTGLTDYFDQLINSHEIGIAKEQDGFWEKLQQRVSYDPARTLLIDDSINVLESARRYGIAHLMAVLRPDSQGKDIETENYQALVNFSEIIPQTL